MFKSVPPKSIFNSLFLRIKGLKTQLTDWNGPWSGMCSRLFNVVYSMGCSAPWREFPVCPSFLSTRKALVLILPCILSDTLRGCISIFYIDKWFFKISDLSSYWCIVFSRLLSPKYRAWSVTYMIMCTLIEEDYFAVPFYWKLIPSAKYSFDHRAH